MAVSRSDIKRAQGIALDLKSGLSFKVDRFPGERKAPPIITKSFARFSFNELGRKQFHPFTTISSRYFQVGTKLQTLPLPS
jgi:hypothetical protein